MSINPYDLSSDQWDREDLAEKIHMDVKTYVTSGLTEDQAYHAVAHARNISLHEVEEAVKLDDRASRRWEKHLQDVASGKFERDWDRSEFSFNLLLVIEFLFFVCLIFVWLGSAK